MGNVFHVGQRQPCSTCRNVFLLQLQGGLIADVAAEVADAVVRMLAPVEEGVGLQMQAVLAESKLPRDRRELFDDVTAIGLQAGVADSRTQEDENGAVGCQRQRDIGSRLVDRGLGRQRKRMGEWVVEDDIAVESATERGRERLFAVSLVGEKIDLAELASTAMCKGDAGRKNDIGLDAERREVGLRVGTVDDGDASTAKGV